MVDPAQNTFASTPSEALAEPLPGAPAPQNLVNRTDRTDTDKYTHLPCSSPLDWLNDPACYQMTDEEISFPFPPEQTQDWDGGDTPH